MERPVKNFVKRSVEQSNPPPVKQPLLRQTLRYKAMLDMGVSIERSEIPAQVMDTLLILESRINEYQKKEQDKIERKIKTQNLNKGV